MYSQNYLYSKNQQITILTKTRCKQVQNNYHKVITCIGLTGILLTFLFAAITNINIWDMFIAGCGTDAYMDFFNHIKYCEIPAETYYVTHHACFPALAYCFYYLLGRLLPSDAIVMFHADKTAPYAHLVYIIYVMILVSILCNLISYVLKNYKKTYVFLFEVQVLLSLSFIAGNIERGNSSFVVLILLLLSLVLRDSDKAIHRELALILIAVAAGLKIYPAVFGILYLGDKKYKESIRLIVYGVLFFFVPFIFFGGIDGLKQFVLNQITVQETCPSWLTISGLMHNALNGIVSAKALTTIISVTRIAAGLILGVVFFKSKRQYVRLCALVSAIILLPGWSGMYVASYYLIPLLYYLRDENIVTDNHRKNLFAIVINISFAMIFTLVQIGTFFSMASIICILGCYILPLAVCTFTIFDKSKNSRLTNG